MHNISIEFIKEDTDDTICDRTTISNDDYISGVSDYRSKEYIEAVVLEEDSDTDNTI